MLVPLETLAGWPTAPDPNPLHVLGLLFGLPLLVAIIISVLIKARSLSAAGRGGTQQYADPTWLGPKQSGQEILGDDNAAGQAALQGGPGPDQTGTDQTGDQTGTDQHSVKTHPDKADDRGGASARW